MFSFHTGRGCGSRHGSRHGSWRRGPFEIHWEVGPGEGRRRRRRFDGEELRLILLKLIADEPRHGYDLIRAIEERTGGAYAPSPGVVYPTLTMLDDMGLVEAAAEGSRKQFSVTEAGQAHLAERADQVEALFEQLDAMGEERSRVDRGPIRRAMGNLSSVLHQRMAGGEMSRDTLHDIAEIIDEAARKIERM